MNIIGLIGILLAIALLIYITMKGFNPIWTTIPIVFIICITNGISFTDGWLTTMIKGASETFVSFAPLLIAGFIFAGIYGMSGAAQSVVNGILSGLNHIIKPKPGKEQKAGIWITLLLITIVSCVFSYVGLDGMVVQVTIFPIAVSLCKRYDIPRVVLPALLYTNVTIGSLPYAISSVNILNSQLLGTDVGCEPIPAIIVSAVGLLLVVIYINNYMNRKCRTQHFEPNPELDPSVPESVSLPHFIVALIPFVLTFALNLIGIQMPVALCISTILELILFMPQLRAIAKATNQSCMAMIRDNMNHQSKFAVEIIATIVLLVGYSAVIRETTVFNTIITALTSGSGSMLYVYCAIALMVSVFLSSNPVAGMMTNLSIVGPYFIKAGIPATHLHRMNQIACTVFDSLPTCVGILMAHQITGVKLKDGYPPLLVITVIIPLIQMILMTALLALGL